MKRLAVVLLALVLWAAPVWAATIYVDPGCTVAGNGTGGYTSTCDASADGNPTTTISAALTAITSAGDVMKLRGLHSSHGSCTSGFDGRYGANDRIQITENGTAGNPIIIEPEGYTTVGAGTEEAVYIDGTAAPGSGANLGWTACSDCSAGSAVVACRNVPSTCGDVWWTDKTVAGNPGNQILMLWAQRPDGSMTFRENKTTCTGATLDNQYDSCSPETDGGVLAVRWGASTPDSTNKPYVVFDNNGYDFYLNNSTYITIRGLNFRAVRRSHIIFVGTTNNIVISDNTFAYASSTNGADHAVSCSSPGNATNITISDNDMGYIGSEAIHGQALSAGATVYTIQRNYIHDLGDLTVMGPGAGLANTPTCIIMGDNSGGSSNGNYTGSVMEDNLCVNTGTGSSVGRGIGLENVSTNWIVRNNILKNIAGECMHLAAGGGSGVVNNEIYNNLFIGCGLRSVDFRAEGAGPVSGNWFYNNTMVGGSEIGIDSSSIGTLQNNLIRNNIMVPGSGKKCLEWVTTDSSNHFQNNLCNTAANPAARWLNVSYACADLDTIETGNKECADPVFVSATDFHIQTSSPAKDAGTATGMPAGRTADITNTIAALHGLPDYNDADAIQGGTWDIGADEFVAAGTGRRPMVISLVCQ